MRLEEVRCEAVAQASGLKPAAAGKPQACHEVTNYPEVSMPDLKQKAPAFQFYVRDWLSDPPLRRCSRTTMSLWIDMLAMMWLEEERGKFVVREEVFCHTFPCSVTERNAFIADARVNGLCGVTKAPDGTLTFICRRMHSEWKAAQSNRMRQGLYRRRHARRQASPVVTSDGCGDTWADDNSEITPPSSSASATASATAGDTPLCSKVFPGDESLRQGLGFIGEEITAKPCRSVTAPEANRTCEPRSIGDILKGMNFGMKRSAGQGAVLEQVFP